jgi:uncharacterized protein (TIGR02246 family)
MRTSRIIAGVVGVASASLLAAALLIVGNEPPSSAAEPASPPPAAPAAATAPAPMPHAALTPPPTPAAAMSADETAIRHVVDEFTQAYNHADAKAIAALFTPEAEIVAEDGETHQGRAEIEDIFSAIFKDHPQAHIDIHIDSIRFVSPTTAVEIGSSTVAHEPENPAEHSRYEVIHVKQNGQWRMASARDLPDETGSASEQLKQLGWLVGDWVDENPDSLVVSTYRWSENKHFILCDFTVKIEGRPVMSGTQRIGWDPLSKKIRSWAFDSEGGYMEGSWSREGNQWIIKSQGATSDGKEASATNYVTRVKHHHMTWESRDREVGGEKTADLGPFTITRQPPKPLAEK